MPVDRSLASSVDVKQICLTDLQKRHVWLVAVEYTQKPLRRHEFLLLLLDPFSQSFLKT